MKICLCYPVHCTEQKLLLKSIDKMYKYDWITKIVVLYTDISIGLSLQSDRIELYCNNYGLGFDKPVEKGGFNSLLARNELIRLGERSECDWLLLCDADEFFLYDTINSFHKAEQENKTGIVYKKLNIINQSTAVIIPELQIRHGNEYWTQPSIRGIRCGHNTRYIPAPNSHTWINYTEHANPNTPIDMCLFENNNYLIHTKYIYKNPDYIKNSASRITYFSVSLSHDVL